MTFTPEDVNRGKSKPKPRAGLGSDDERSPLDQPDEPGKAGDDTLPGDKRRPTPSKPAEPSDWLARRPRLVGTLGFGTWIRSFSINQPADEKWKSSYSSGATLTLKFAAEAFPLAYFLDTFAQDFLARFSFQMALGLTSGVAGAGTSGLSTSMNEFLFELGYRWNILQKQGGPELEGTFGLGSTNFSIDWGQATRSLPDASYTFLSLGLGGLYRFLPFLGAHLRLAYRIVAGNSGVSDDEAPGYGDASVGGINLAVGVTGYWKSFVASFEYVFTHYFYSFNDVTNRSTQNVPTAGGALDQYHAIMVNGGYSF
jgi:hypothetical protein